MSCPICRRQACIQSFHSLEEQERFEKRQNMPDDVDTLRELLQAEREEVKELKREIKDLRTDHNSHD